MSTTDPKDIVNLQFAMINEGRPDLAPQVFHPDMVIDRMGIQYAVEFLLARRAATVVGGDAAEGFQNVGKALADAFPDNQLELVGPQIAEGDLVVTRVKFTGTHAGDFLGVPPTGKKIEFFEVLFMRIADDKIIHVWGIGDELSFLQQLGVLGDHR